MFGKGEDIFYYITLLNENYVQPEMVEGAEEGINRGMYLYRKGDEGALRVQLMGSGAIFREVIAAAELLVENHGVQADVWSILGVNQLHRDGLLVEDWNRRHPDQSPRKSYVEEVLSGFAGPAIISTDYVQAYGEQLRRLIPNPLTILGTDGFGRSDSREVLRQFFKVDRYHVVIAALKALADQGALDYSAVSKAIHRYGIQPDAPHPITR
jgi:pyruvate dehydrogenase E1 component